MKFEVSVPLIVKAKSKSKREIIPCVVRISETGELKINYKNKEYAVSESHDTEESYRITCENGLATAQKARGASLGDDDKDLNAYSFGDINNIELGDLPNIMRIYDKAIHDPQISTAIFSLKLKFLAMLVLKPGQEPHV